MKKVDSGLWRDGLHVLLGFFVATPSLGGSKWGSENPPGDLEVEREGVCRL